MALTLKQLNDVCFKFGGTKQCRYLDEEYDDLGRIVFVCKKLSPEKKIIDSEIVDYFNETFKSGGDPFKLDVPLGDNCQGFLPFKALPQGYDVKS
jgi:hypothetical protein